MCLPRILQPNVHQTRLWLPLPKDLFTWQARLISYFRLVPCCRRHGVCHFFLTLGGWLGRFGTWTLKGGTVDMRFVIAFPGNVLGTSFQAENGSWTVGVGSGSFWGGTVDVRFVTACPRLFFGMLSRWGHKSNLKYQKWQGSFISIRPATTYVNT